jgi:hypothetical protein
MQTETLAIVRPPNAGDQELVSRLIEGFGDASRRVAVYSPPEVCTLSAEDLGGTTLLVASPAQCIEQSGDESGFLSRVAGAHKRILAWAGPVDGTGYRGRLSRGIDFDAVFDLGFVPQGDNHSGISEVPYYFVFNGRTREEEPLSDEPDHPDERTIPWVLVGPKTEKNRDLLGELFEHDADPGGFCLLNARLKNMAAPGPMIGGPQLSAVLSRARYSLWSADRPLAYYESFRFIGPLLAGTVPCKIDPDLVSEELAIPGVYASVAAFQKEAKEIGYGAMYRRARDFYVSGGLLAEHLSGALSLV